MKALDALRQYLLDPRNSLGLSSEHLITQAREGFLELNRTNQDIALPYRAHVLIESYNGDPARVFHVFAHWYRTYAPARVENAEIEWEVEVIDHRTVDIAILCPLGDHLSITSRTEGERMEWRAVPPEISPVIFPPLEGSEGNE